MFVYMLARATLFCQHSASNLLCLCLCPVQTLQKICFTYFILRPILKETLHRSLHVTTIDLQLAGAVECCCFQYFHLESCCSTAANTELPMPRSKTEFFFSKSLFSMSTIRGRWGYLKTALIPVDRIVLS